MITEIIKNLIKKALEKEKLEIPSIVLEHPEEISYGDYSTNVALILAKEAKQNPKVLAEKIAEEIKSNLPKEIERVEVAGVGFINFFLSKDFFRDALQSVLSTKENFGKSQVLSGKTVLFEYTDPNAFKPFHIGHLMANTIGEALSRLAESQGAEVKRICYGGDVGLHVAKAIWGMQKARNVFPHDGDTLRDKTKFLGDAYVLGNTAYEEDASAQKEIKEINKKIFEMLEGNSPDDTDILVSYEKGRKWSLEHFEEIFKKLGTHFDKYFFESEMASLGKKIVLDNIGKVFEKSEGAIIFKGEDHGLHTRVFLTSEGLPPYEAKELALFVKKIETFPKNDISVVITANEQNDYFRVVQKVLEILYPKEAKKMTHISHGLLRFASGKMSSRKGNVVTGESLIKDTEEDVREKISDRGFDQSEKEKIAEAVAVSAIKYSILRQRPGKDVIYDKEKSLSLEGDSGPYLQYALVRAYSILEKGKNIKISTDLPNNWQTTYLEKLFPRFGEIILRSWEEKAPQTLASYLLEISGAFNAFYGQGKIVDEEDKDSSYKMAIVLAFSEVLASGLSVLGITPLHKM